MKHYPHHIGDFDRATRHLTRLERSVYRDMLDLYYETEKPLPIDIEKLCRRLIARSSDEVTAVKQVLTEFFTETPIGWYQDRCEAEIAAYRANSSQKALAGKASAEAKRLRKQQALNGASTAVEQPLKSVATEINGESTNHKPSTINQEPITNTSTSPRKRGDGESLFSEFWKAYPKKVGKDAAQRAFEKRKPTQELLKDMLRALEVQTSSLEWRKDDGQFIPHPATWLNQGRWLDEVGSAGHPVNPLFAGAI